MLTLLSVYDPEAVVLRKSSVFELRTEFTSM
jgi:hypothetical protein